MRVERGGSEFEGGPHAGSYCDCPAGALCRGSGPRHDVLVSLRPIEDPTVLRRIPYGDRFCADGGDRCGEKTGSLLRLQTHQDPAVLRWNAFPPVGNRLRVVAKGGKGDCQRFQLFVKDMALRRGDQPERGRRSTLRSWIRYAAACPHLRRVDPIMRALISHVGPCR